MSFKFKVIAAYRCLLGKPTIFHVKFTDVVRMSLECDTYFICCSFDDTYNKSGIRHESYPYKENNIILMSGYKK